MPHDVTWEMKVDSLESDSIVMLDQEICEPEHVARYRRLLPPVPAAPA